MVYKSENRKKFKKIERKKIFFQKSKIQKIQRNTKNSKNPKKI